MTMQLSNIGPGEEKDEDTRKDEVERDLIEREADEDYRGIYHDFSDEYL